jgi:hypothetical protein
LEFRWLSLAEQAHETGGALGHESRLTAALFPLHHKPAAYPAEAIALSRTTIAILTTAFLIE